MSKHLYWLDEAAWRAIEPLLPRGRRGARRVDDRRVISGIMHMLKTGARWRDCPAEYGPYTTIYNPFNRWSRQGVWTGIFKALTGRRASGPAMSPSTPPRSRPPLGGGRKRVAFFQSIGRSRGGRTTKIHGLVDDKGRPRVLLLSAGNINDITMARYLVEAAGPFHRLLADRGYNADHLRKLLADRNAEAVIPTATSRRAPIPYDVATYRRRNTVERLWARLKDFRRVATPYDKLAANFLTGVQIAALIAYWPN